MSRILSLPLFLLLLATTVQTATANNLHYTTEPADTVAPDSLPNNSVLGKGSNVSAIVPVLQDSATAVIVSRLNALTGEELFKHSQLGLYVYDLTADTPVFGCGQDQQLRPASCEKIVTAVTALSKLGPDYRYRTQLLTDGKPADSLLNGNLYLRGGFDPLIGNSDVKLLVGTLKEQGITHISGDLVFDRTFKDTASKGWGWCWDDDDTPLTPMLYNARPGLEKYFSEALKNAGIVLQGRQCYGTVPRRAELLTERMYTVRQVLPRMMKQSDNLFAETLFYQLAASDGRHYAGRQRAVHHIEDLLSSLDIDAGTYQIADGSGLSLYNYLTPRLLVALLRHAHSNAGIYRELLQALPVAGRDGTLRRRMTSGSAHGNVRAKTGTLEGVITLAGYCTAANGHLLCFAIMNQGILKGSVARRFQDRVCQALTE